MAKEVKKSFPKECVLASLVTLVVKNFPANAVDSGLIPESGRSPGEGNGNSLQYSCLINSMGRGASGATPHGVAKSQIRLSNFTPLSLHFTRAKYLSVPRTEPSAVSFIDAQ